MADNIITIIGTAPISRACNIFFKSLSVYFTIYRQYFFFLSKFEQFHEYLIQHSLKSGSSKDHS